MDVFAAPLFDFPGPASLIVATAHTPWKLVRALTTVLLLAATCNGQTLCASRLPSLPQPISNNAVTSLRHADGTYSLFSFMGLASPSFNGATSASYRLDLPGGSWTRIADAPRLNNRAKIGASAITVAGEVYLIGGYTISRARWYVQSVQLYGRGI